MNGKLFIVFVCVAVATAIPIENAAVIRIFAPEPDEVLIPKIPQVHIRKARQAQWMPSNNNNKFQFQIPAPTTRSFQFIPSGAGTGQSGQIGFDSKFKIYESPNGRHGIGGTAGMTRQYGIQPNTDYRIGAGYTFRF